MGSYAQTTHSTQCHWQSKAQLTFQQISDQGLCIEKVTPEWQPLCNWTLMFPSSQEYLIPHNDIWWACFIGPTPCTHALVLNETNGFCVIVQLVPRLVYHTEEDLYSKLGRASSKVRREPVTALTLTILLGTSLVGGDRGCLPDHPELTLLLHVQSH